MPELDVRPSAGRTSDPEALIYESQIQTRRREYARIDNHPENEHEFFGLVEDLPVVIRELQRVIDEQQRMYPGAHFLLEYHKSCTVNKNDQFLIYSFHLVTYRIIHQQESRLNSVISWKFDQKTDYSAENALVENFAQQNGIRLFEQKGVRSVISD